MTRSFWRSLVFPLALVTPVGCGDGKGSDERDGEDGAGEGEPYDGDCLDPGESRYCFKESTIKGLGAGPLVLVDVNQDQRLDIVVLEAVANQVTVALGDDSGHFSPLSPVPVGAMLSSASLLAGQFAGPDKGPMVLLLRRNTAEFTLLQNDGEGALAPGPTTAFESLAPLSSAVVAVDLDGDQWSDLVVGSFTGALHFVDNQGGVFEIDDIQIPIEGCAPTGVASLASKAQTLELVVSTGACGSAAAGLPALHLVGPNPAALAVLGSFPTGTDAVSLAVGELDGVPGNDVVIANRVSGDITVLRRVGDELILGEPIAIASFCGECEEISDVAIANLDGDAYGEIVLIAQYPGKDGFMKRAMFVIEDALSDEPKWLWLRDDWTAPVIADLDGDGLDDIVTHDQKSVLVLLGM